MDSCGPLIKTHPDLQSGVGGHGNYKLIQLFVAFFLDGSLLIFELHNMWHIIGEICWTTSTQDHSDLWGPGGSFGGCFRFQNTNLCWKWRSWVGEQGKILESSVRYLRGGWDIREQGEILENRVIKEQGHHDSWHLLKIFPGTCL